MKIIRWVGMFLIIIGVCLRIYQFGSIPVALNRDEAALGYNAFAIAHSGMDEWGQRYPFLFKSFGDYKLPGYIYLTTVGIKIFGVSDIVIRLPSLLAGLGIIVISYAFARFFGQTKAKSLVVAGFVALQPWSLFYSRMAYEANVGLFWFLFSVYGLLHAKWTWQVAGIISFFMAILTYNAPLLLTPIILIMLILYPSVGIRRKIISSLGVLSVSIALFVLLIPVTQQKQAITIMSDPTLIEQQAQAYTAATSLPEKVWWYKQIFWLRLIADRFVRSFSPGFLTIRGGSNPWHTVPGGAHFFWTTYGLFWIGVGLGLHTMRRFSVRKWLVAFLLIGSLLPAVLTVDAPHATRSLFFFWMITMISGWSFLALKPWMKKLMLIILVVEIVTWSWKYYSLFPDYKSTAWPIGLRESLLQTKGKKVALLANSSDAVADQIYIYPLLYWQIPPKDYVDSVSMMPVDNVNMIRVSGFKNFRITSSAYPDEHIIERLKNGYFYVK